MCVIIRNNFVGKYYITNITDQYSTSSAIHFKFNLYRNQLKIVLLCKKKRLGCMNNDKHNILCLAKNLFETI